MDIKVWAYAMIFFNITTVTYALAYFLPIILMENMGFSVGASQCLVAPPNVLAGILMYISGWIGDRYRMRGPIIVFNCLLCLIGLPMMGFHPKPAVRYVGVFLVSAGANANVPAAMSYQANNIRGQWKRAFCSATFVSFDAVVADVPLRPRDVPSGPDQARQVVAVVDPPRVGRAAGVAKEQGTAVPVGERLPLLDLRRNGAVGVQPDVAVCVHQSRHEVALRDRPSVRDRFVRDAPVDDVQLTVLPFGEDDSRAVQRLAHTVS